MKIRLWGTRGSIPSPGPSTIRYGGNTSCVEVRLSDGTLIILDAGSGIRPLGAALGACQATLLLSHYHWDHIQGLPFFGSAYLPESEIRVVGPEFEGEGPEEYLVGQMMTPYFPAAPSQLHGIASFETVPRDVMRIGPAEVRVGRLSHPGVTFGYRIEEDGATLVYISDNEPDVASAGEIEGIMALARDADLLIHDCQYSEGEYVSCHRWGHSTPRQAVRIARGSGARRLMLFHHDPGHNDEQVEALAEEACRLAGTLEVVIAREGEIHPVSRAPRRRAGASARRLAAQAQRLPAP
ncbi:MAG TPA: MBL fold metallo-hydrolase [Chloroflexota bacterium]|nr:MBL fold metallo-hydrolase [Chloroflexota bacterium]